MTIPLFIIGAGGFGREVYSIVEAIAESGGARYEAVFIDDSPSPANAGRVHRLGSEIVGDVGFLVGARESCAAIIAVGSAADRSALAFRLLGAPVTFPSLTHPDSTVGLGVDLSEGVVIAAGARLSTNIDIGRHVHIDQNAVVGHDATLGDYCRLGPQACISGNVSIGPRALVGANATVLQGIAIGSGSTIGAGAVVTRSVLQSKTVVGVPARERD